jgi:dephospho-CoA kinase
MAHVIALVGMPGSGKSTASTFLEQAGYSRFRFGDVTEEYMITWKDKLQELGLDTVAAQEQYVRTELRRQYTDLAYAKLLAEKVQSCLDQGQNVVCDGLISWEEHQHFTETFGKQYIPVGVLREKAQRYSYLAQRPERPLTPEQSHNRDHHQIKYLRQGGPIAMAHYFIHDDQDKTALHNKVKSLLVRLC